MKNDTQFVTSIISIYIFMFNFEFDNETQVVDIVLQNKKKKIYRGKRKFSLLLNKREE